MRDLKFIKKILKKESLFLLMRKATPVEVYNDMLKEISTEYFP